MTREEKKRFYNAEVRHVAETLYTLAGLAYEDETTTVEDLMGNFLGYDPKELQEVAKDARNAVKNQEAWRGLSDLSRRLMARRICRDEAPFLVAEAIEARAFEVIEVIAKRRVEPRPFFRRGSEEDRG